MLEEAIKENTEAILKLTEVILQNGNCAPAVKEKRPRRTKDEIASDKAAAEAKKNEGLEATPKDSPAASLDLGLGNENPATGEEVTLETLKANGMLLVGCGTNQEGLETARALIETYGVKMMDEVKPEDYPKLNAQFIEEAKNWGKKSAVNTQL